MKHFADAYARALLPRRYGPVIGAGRAHDADALGLASDGVDVAIGAACYRLVVAVETLLDAAPQRLRRRPTGTAHRPATNTPVGCG